MTALVLLVGGLVAVGYVITGITRRVEMQKLPRGEHR